MGLNRNEDTHVKRSSSMSFALRWKHDNLRIILIVALLTVALLFFFLTLMHGTAAKSVSLVINGETKEVTTNQWKLDRLLDEQGITLREHDKISKPVDAQLEDGDQVVIDLAKSVVVTADGKTVTVHTTLGTVASVLQEQNIVLGKEDKVEPALDTVLTDSAAIKVVRVKTVTEETEHNVPYKVVKKNDSKLLKGKEKTVQGGKEGLIVKQFEKVYEDGKLVSERLVSKVVKEEAVNQVVAIGTKKPVTVLSASSPDVEAVTKRGITFKYKSTLTGVKLTAYSAGVESTGKSKSHPSYGITSSGTRVTEGRTIAVDPKIIPMGWWVYIEGIGFRRAEDTGSAVKGKKIDVYFDSEAYATKFGAKSGYKVYVIGPKKPEMN